MSSRTSGVAVAVRATIGTSGNRSLRTASDRYSGRNWCPHIDMQCASSTAISVTGSDARSVRKSPSTAFSGET